MATTKDVKKTESGRVSYRGETFAGFNKPKRTAGKNKKFAVLARQGKEVKLVRYGDPNMRIRTNDPERNRSFRARHKCSTAKDKLTARYWSCRGWPAKNSKAT
tara:strand:- start:66 stop:374 length:309 start_codon:yes stop_codon:yes gene_type:complete